VCAFLLNKMLASTIQLSTPTPLGAGQPAQPHPVLIPSSFRRKGQETTTQHLLIEQTRVIPQGPTVCQDQTDFGKLQVPRPHRSRDSTEKRPVTDQSFIDDSTSE